MTPLVESAETSASSTSQPGCSSVTLYETNNKLLIPNDLKIDDRTTFSSEPNQDETTTITLSPNGSGKNGTPTGKDFYGILPAYVQAPDTILKVKIEKQSQIVA
jgi:hypothetical protein